MTRLISVAFLVATIVVVGVLFYRVMSMFLLPLFMAALLVVIFEPVWQWYLRRCGNRRHRAAGLARVTFVAIVLVPVILLITMAASELLSLENQFSVATFKVRLARLRTSAGLEMPLAASMAQVEKGLAALKSANLA